MDSVVYGNDGGGSRLVVTELSHIKQLVAQLEVHLGGESPDLCKSLASQIFSLTERSIGIITSSDHFNGGGGGRNKRSVGLASATPSPLSDVVDAPFKTNKKRKTMEKRTHQVRVTSGGEAATPVDDGHSWRKYGQKEILGAKHPRSYYRCTHRHSQGCMATKQVQRTDEDLALFDVIYLGTHTCVHKMVAVAATAAGGATEPLGEHNPNAHGLLQSLSANLTVKTEGLAAAAEQQGWSATAPFGVTSSTPASACLAPERSPLSAPSTTSENWGVSPATSDSNHVFSFPPAEWREEYELQEVMSALLAASTPAPAPAVDDFHDFDISSFLV